MTGSGAEVVEWALSFYCAENILFLPEKLQSACDQVMRLSVELITQWNVPTVWLESVEM